MNLLEQCQIWHENDEFQKIIDAIEALPEHERTPETDCELARAYNNLAGSEDRDLLKKAIQLMKPHEEYFKGNFSFYYRMGYAYYYLDQEGYALSYFEQALETLPDDQDTLDFIKECIRCLSIPSFKRNFRQRSEEAWQAFEKNEAQLRQWIDQRGQSDVVDQLINKCRDILSLAFENSAFELGFNGKKYELILSPEGKRAELFQLVYFKRHMPDSLSEKWNVWVGRQASKRFGLRHFGLQVSADEVSVWTEKTEDNHVNIALYCDALMPLLAEDESKAWWFLSVLTDQTLGEIPAMMLINDFNVLTNPKSETSLSLSELPEHLEKMGFDLKMDAEEYLERSYVSYHFDANNDPNADWRMDVLAGSTCCPTFINEYLNLNNQTNDAFHNDGIAVGFFCYPLDNFPNEDRGSAILDFRDSMEAMILKNAGADAVTFIGGASGIYCGYLDFIAWDLHAVLHAAQEAFEKSPVQWVNYHSFRRNAQMLSLVDKESEKPQSKHLS